MKTCVTPACLSSLQVMSKKKSVLENSCLNCRSCTLYESRLEGLVNAKSVNKTRLKGRLLEYFKEAQEWFDGRITFLVLKEGMRNMIQDALKKRNFSEDALILARAASIIRKDIFNHEGILFNGSFSEKCQHTSLPSSLKTLRKKSPKHASLLARP